MISTASYPAFCGQPRGPREVRRGAVDAPACSARWGVNGVIGDFVREALTLNGW